MRKLCVRAIVLSALAVVSFLVCRSNAAAAARYLYVSSSTSHGYPSVARFRLVRGIPQSHPDRVYQGYGGLLAVAGDGTLYVAQFRSIFVIYAFPPDRTKPSREIDIPNDSRKCGSPSPGGITNVSAIAGDQSGALFAGIETVLAARRHYASDFDAVNGLRHLPCNGIAIFGPQATHHDPPIQVIRYAQGWTTPGLGVDSMDDLYVANPAYRMVEWSNAVLAPTRSRVFEGRYITSNTGPVAVDAAGNVFLFTQSSNSGWIDRYAPDAPGKGRPTSIISFEGLNYFVFSIAVEGRYLYAATFGANGYDAVDVYDALRNGTQSPLASLAVTNISSIATGP